MYVFVLCMYCCLGQGPRAEVLHEGVQQVFSREVSCPSEVHK